MGTNYYLEPQPPCPHCGRAYERRHIGKASCGWCFALHVYPEEGIRTLEDWIALWSDKRIFDEYGEEVSHQGIINCITQRSHREIPVTPYGYDSWKAFHRQNGSVPGPNGLVRCAIDGRHCIGHGKGTWDLVVGEFS